MFGRRQLIKSWGAFAMAGVPGFLRHYSRSFGAESEIPVGGVPSIIDGGVVQFTYPDGTIIEVHDDRLEITRRNGSHETRPRRFPIDVQTAALPTLPSDPTLRTWLDTLAADLRGTITALLRGDNVSNRRYDAYERDLSLTIYKKIAVRFKYIKRLTGLE